MSSDSNKDLARLFKQWASVSALIIQGKRTPREVSTVLQKIIAQSSNIDLLKSPEDQISAWLEACNRGNLGISLPEFDAISNPPELTDQDRKDGFVGVGLFYGFGSKGGHSDMVLSGKIAWEYTASQRETWKWGSYPINFDDPRCLKPRNGAHPRPQGFYWKKVQLGRTYQEKSVAEVRSILPETDWGMGPEGIQLAITHPHYVVQMNGRDVLFMDLPDYAFAPAVDGNFFRSLSLCYSDGDGEFLLSSGLVARCSYGFGSGSLR